MKNLYSFIALLVSNSCFEAHSQVPTDYPFKTFMDNRFSGSGYNP